MRARGNALGRDRLPFAASAGSAGSRYGSCAPRVMGYWRSPARSEKRRGSGSLWMSVERQSPVLTRGISRLTSDEPRDVPWRRGQGRKFGPRDVKS